MPVNEPAARVTAVFNRFVTSRDVIDVNAPGSGLRPTALNSVVRPPTSKALAFHSAFINFIGKTMDTMTTQDLSEAMAKIDFAMLTTHAASGDLASRPMSNNGEVEWTGDSFYFSWDSAKTVADIEREPKVALSFQGDGHLLGKPPLFIAIEGRASLIRDKVRFEEHWHKELDRWFPDGVDSDGLILIQIHAHRAHYWDGEEENEVPV